MNNLEKQLEEANEALEKISKAVRGANGKDEKMKQLIQEQAEAAARVKGLEATIAALNAKEQVPEEIAKVSKSLEKHRQQKAAKVKNAEKALNDNREAIEEAREKAREMIEAGEIERIIEQNQLIESLQSRDQELQKAVNEIKAVKTFPEGFFLNEWEKYAEQNRKEWDQLISEVERAKENYALAVDALLSKHSALLQIRRYFRVAAQEDGEKVNFPRILTDDMLGTRLSISKSDGARVRETCSMPSSCEGAL